MTENIDDLPPIRRRRPRVVTIIDIGLHPSFDSSTAVIQSALRSLDLGGEESTVAVDIVRTRDVPTILSAFTAPSDVVHVIAHSDHVEGDPAFSSEDGRTVVPLSDLQQHVYNTGRAVSAPVVLLDGCKTIVQVWQKEFARCLETEAAYIGSSRMTGWHDSLVFCPAFYASLFRGVRRTCRVEHALDAAGRAAEAFATLTGHDGPYRSVRLASTR